jgi:hypothetical protein
MNLATDEQFWTFEGGVLHIVAGVRGITFARFWGGKTGGQRDNV